MRHDVASGRHGPMAIYSFVGALVGGRGRVGGNGEFCQFASSQGRRPPPGTLFLRLGHGIGTWLWQPGSGTARCPLRAPTGQNGLHSRPCLLVQTTEARVAHEYDYVTHATRVQSCSVPIVLGTVPVLMHAGCGG